MVIAVVAFGVRAAFAWNQAAKIPEEVVGTIPFQTETGHIAYSVATGKGFSSPFQRDSGPTAWLTPVYPLIVTGIFKVFGVYTRGIFPGSDISEHYFFFGYLRADFLCGKTDRGDRRGQWRRVAVGAVSECDSDSV